jgi:hypothetical protein
MNRSPPIALSGFSFPVIASAGAEDRARRIAARTERAHRWMTDVFHFSPVVKLHVLGPDDWAELARQPVYGFPHPGAGGIAIFVAATDFATLRQRARDPARRPPGQRTARLRRGLWLAAEPRQVRRSALAA